MGGGQHKLFDKPSSYGYALKADIRHYFDTIDHEILSDIIKRKIKDKSVLWLIRTIMKNHKVEVVGKGMPIGNLTSQFFANVYLNELDYFVKHKLRARYYLRYVDDFIILHKDKETLEKWKSEIDTYLKNNLKIDLHPEKSRIISLEKGTTLLGFRVFYYYRLLKKSNARRILKRLEKFKCRYEKEQMSKEEIVHSIQGWMAYAKFANTYNLRNKVLEQFYYLFLSADANIL